MKALVLGGAGFIGSHLADALLKRGHQVRSLDNLESRVHPHGCPGYLDKSIRLLKGDIRDRAAMETALDGVDIVFHQAEYSGSLSDYAKFFHSNAVSTALLFEIIRENHLPVKKVIVASSQAVYGEGQYYCGSHGLVLPESRPVDRLKRGEWEIQCPECQGGLVPVLLREGRTNPSSPYGISKVAQEQVAHHLGGLLGIPTVILRYSVVQGARQTNSNFHSGICQKLVDAFQSGKAPIIFEDGKQLRDYVHVSDVVAANLLVSEDSRADGQTYNVGTGRGTTVLDYVRVLMQKMKAPFPPEIPGAYRAGDCRHAIPSIAKLQMLGWKPVRGLNEIVTDYLGWIDTAGNQRERFTPHADAFEDSGTMAEVVVEEAAK